MAATHHNIELTHRGRVLALLAGLAAAAAWLGDDANARIAAALLAAPLLVDFVKKQRHLHHTEIGVGKRFTAVGAAFTERLELTHRSPRPARECLLFEPRTMRVEPPILLPALQPHQPLRASMRQRSLVRSHVLERVFVLTSTWPLGLFRSRAVVVVPTELITLPAAVPLRAELKNAIAEREAAHLVRTNVRGAEFHSLREHQPDEDARGVHALRSATAGTLVRRVLRGSLPRIAGVVLDLRRPPGRRLDQGIRRFEWSLGICVSLITHLREHGIDLQVLVLDSEPTRLMVRSPRDQNDFFTLLAEASPAPHRAVPEEIFDELQRLEHCFWIPAGSFLAAPEFAAMPGTVTLVGEDSE
ncbi:MAG: hypothetical protein H6838_04370 [Planctomycetes bacterium]|nr:hypothetical protein [Planctomycetota bacterium]MCB9884701.1 hypothetical protein [Planctomycetota bacterium]